VKRRSPAPAFIAHGGAGRRAPAGELPGRRRGLLTAGEAAARILRDGGDALDAVVAAVVMLEDDPLFNAGYGSYLTTAGTVEMDAAVTTARPLQRRARGREPFAIGVGGVVMVRRVRNPILLARAVMERTPHILMGGAGAERLAREAGLRLCRPEAMVAARSRERWLALARGKRRESEQHGTVGAVALDSHGNLAAATSTGGVTLKLPGRIGDSAIPGAGLYANPRGAASATGEGEAILKTALCRETVEELRRKPAPEAVVNAIKRLAALTGGEAGIITVDAKGNLGYTHNAVVMEIATFNPVEGVRHRFAPGIERGR
jgi:beta-aspartyl-peptidase (threonine type)